MEDIYLAALTCDSVVEARYINISSTLAEYLHIWAMGTSLKLDHRLGI